MYVLSFFKRPFIIIIQTPYLGTGSKLSWVKPVTVKLVKNSREIGTIQQTKQLLKVVISILI